MVLKNKKHSTIEDFKNQKVGTWLVLDSSNLPSILDMLKDRGYESAGHYQKILPICPKI